MRAVSPRWTRALVALFLVLAAVVGGGFYWDARGRVATVEAGHLYRSKAMPPDRLLEVARELGIKTVIDLRQPGPGVTAEADALANTGIAHVNLPSTQVPDLATVDRFLEVMRDETRHPVLLHCRHGVGRTGVFAAVYRMERQGWSAGWASLEALVMAGGGSFGPFSDKRAFLQQYRPRAAGAAGPGSGSAARPATP